MRESPSEAWARCRPYVEAALAHAFGDYTLDDVAVGIEGGRFHFWPGKSAAVVTEFWTSPRAKALNVWLMGGSLSELRNIYPALEDFARLNGCSEITGGGLHEKRGWTRVCQGFGLKPRWTIYSKELT